MRKPILLLLAVACTALIGCGSQPAPAPTSAAAPALQPAAETPPAPPKPNWTRALDSLGAAIASSELDRADELLATCRAAENDLSDDDKLRLTKLAEELKSLRAAAGEQRRAELLATAKGRVQDGDLEAAASALEKLLASSPSEEQKRQADELNAKIETTRRIRRELRTAMGFLAGTDKGNLRTARSRLLQDEEVALPLLLQNLQSDQPVLVANTLEVLRYFNRPDRTIPAMMAILANPRQEANWPDVAAQVQRLEHPGAGPLLLSLLNTVESGKQRRAVLAALAGANDPPPETLAALLPILQQQGEELDMALEAATRAVIVHHQNDLVALPGAAAQFTAEQQEQLRALGQRLQQIVAADTREHQPGPLALAAMKLGVATRQLEPQPLPVVKIDRASHDLPENPAAAVIDGKWAVTEPALLWRHPSNQRVLIVLDLGQVRTITGVRVWNYNEPGGVHRGWKELGVFVSETPSLREAIATGFVPPAPGRADAPDYSTTIQVPFVRGRYIKLEPYSVWRDDGLGGLTEVQVQGF